MLLSGCHLRVLYLSVKSWEFLHYNCSPDQQSEEGVRYRVDAADIVLRGEPPEWIGRRPPSPG